MDVFADGKKVLTNFTRSLAQCMPDATPDVLQIPISPPMGVRFDLPVDTKALDKISKARPDHHLIDMHGLLPAFESGQTVEYYSPTHKIWVVGEIQLTIEKMKKRKEKAFVYNVRLKKSGQLRTRVPLDMIRAPFVPTELVEVFSKRNTGQWMLGTIRGPRAGSNIMKGYKVYIEPQAGAPEMLLENVPSWRIRRRFPARSSVEVYRGPLAGWCKGVVHSVIAAFPAEPPVPLSAFSPGTSADSTEDPAAATAHLEFPWAVPPPIVDDTTKDMREDAATVCGSTVIGEEAMAVHPWVQVPVYVEEWDEEEWGRDPDIEKAQWVPSFLLRMNMIDLASAKDYERRSFMM